MALPFSPRYDNEIIAGNISPALRSEIFNGCFISSRKFVSARPKYCFKG